MNKRIIAGIILILNLTLITIPYTIKNQNLKNDISNLASIQYSENIINEEVDIIDPYKIYDNFSEILNKLDIDNKSVSADIGQDMITIRLEGSFDKNIFFNLITLLDEKIPRLKIIDMEVDFENEERGFITFEAK